MNEYLQDLLLAYKNIPSVYSDDRTIRTRDGNITTQKIERVFLAELYHQWRSMMDANIPKYQNLILHSEIGKQINDNNVQHPDLVLHGGQIGQYRNLNVLYVELKMDSIDVDDFQKAFNAIERLNYQNSVYIIHKLNYEQIFYGLSNNEISICLQDNEEHFDNLYVFNNTFKPITLRKLFELYQK